MNKLLYQPFICQIVRFDAVVRTDVISASYWDVGEPDITWDAD